ncbi:MAG: acyl-CoA thioesterase [Bacteroidales bacterium]|nr:acyl-CoA thioesterase [Bacteroidales bacterium]NLK81078.1 acyl-CoA thioesterase [Bacteroidales bacterium]HPY82384.1 thioesterase family protein [Bacteroidales bacterium]
MIRHKHTIRVAYSDTDKMGVVHHSNYAKYFENARWELFRSRGLSYKDIESQGFMFPVISLQSKFHTKALYDDVLTIDLTITCIKAARIYMEFTVYDAHKKRVHTAKLELACVSSQTWKPCAVPQFIVDILLK